MLANSSAVSCDSTPTLGIEAYRQLNRARKVLRLEAMAIQALEETVSDEFLQAVASLLQLEGNLIVTGIGKAGHIGQKLAATFASTGTPSHYVHPSEAMHGDLGRFKSNDIVLVLSNSGETEEITRLLPSIKNSTSKLIAITSKRSSTLAKAADIVLAIPFAEEACSHKLAPTTSTSAMLALGDALALVVSDERGFAADDFARLHPGGSLGMKLRLVDDVMRPIDECRVADIQSSIREVLVKVAKPGRRTGAVMLIGAGGSLVGLFTDSDLARLLERRDDSVLDQPMSLHMKPNCLSITSKSKLKDALSMLADRKISELPVVDSENRALGLIDITDVVAWLDCSLAAPPEVVPSHLKLFSNP